MAIEILEPSLFGGAEAAGQFTLPSNFDATRFAAKWVKVGNAVAAAQQREHLVGTRLTADGWTVWKDGDSPTSGKPHKVHVASGEHVLLFRPRPIQEAVNAIYGNVGKERMLSEKKGETTGGVPINDPGMLSEATLNRALGSEGLPEEDGDVKFNRVEEVSRHVGTSVLETAET